MPNIAKNKASGTKSALGMLAGSVRAKTRNMRSELAINSENNCPVFARNGAGYVQKMPADDVSSPTVRMPRPPSKVSMADM
jgi:hypothetical protein